MRLLLRVELIELFVQFPQFELDLIRLVAADTPHKIIDRSSYLSRIKGLL